MSREQEAKRLLAAARELRESAEQLERLAAALRAASESDELVGAAEIAEMAGVEPNTVATWAKRGHLPAPVATLKGGRIWRRTEIAAWLERRR